MVHNLLNIERKQQKHLIIKSSFDYRKIYEYLKINCIKKLFVVCGNSFDGLEIKDYLYEFSSNLDFNLIFFKNFSSNPKYDEIELGTKLFIKSGCSCILAIGGGSAIDVAKCVKLFSSLKKKEETLNYVEQYELSKFDSYVVQNLNKIKLITVPTTSGTGSESTNFAVLYLNNEKKSIQHDCILPDIFILDASCLQTLSLYQKKATMLDSLSHALESIWSINSTEKSIRYAVLSIKLILSNCDKYLSNEKLSNYNMMIAANLSGKAINISKTTAGHALCYKLSSLYEIPHGYATALCNIEVFKFIVNNLNNESLCCDKRGGTHVIKSLQSIASLFFCKSIQEACLKYIMFVNKLGLKVPNINETDISILVSSVNQARLSNNPILLKDKDIESIYRNIKKISYLDRTL